MVNGTEVQISVFAEMVDKIERFEVTDGFVNTDGVDKGVTLEMWVYFMKTIFEMTS